MARLTMALLVQLLAFGAASRVTPVQKVVSMIGDMLTTAKEAKKTEEVQFATFQQWCTGVQTERKRSIEEEAAQIVQLNADIDQATAEAGVLGEEITELDGTIAQVEAEVANATAVRKTERTDYEATHQDYSESIDAIGRAIQVLGSKTADVAQSLLQVRRSLADAMSPHEKSIIDSLLGVNQAPKANAYENQSGGVIAILEKLLGKFKDEKLSLEKAELAARGNYEVLMQRLTDNAKADKKTVSSKTAAKASELETAATATGDVQLTEKAKVEDEKALSDNLVQCSAKSTEFESNQVLRAGEIEALEKAVEILTSAAVKGNSETYLPSMLQKAKRATSLAQMRTSQMSPHRADAAAYLQAQAAKLGSRYLAVIAQHVNEDPFGKVKSMIKDLIVKLMEEANAEADQHAYCTTELATNKQTREIKGSEVDDLTAKADQLTAQSEQLASDITKLSDDIAEIRGEQAEATKMRTSEKAENTKTVSDSKDAQVAVEQAIQTIRDFYASAAPAFVQVHSAKNSDPYTGLQGESGGVLGMLDVILSDFARLESDTSAAEDQAAAAYKSYTAESTEDVEVKTTELKHKESKKMQTLESLDQTKKELELTQEELTTALDYYEKLNADCVDTGLSFEERTTRREEEVQSLKEALKILDGEDLAA